MFNKHEKTTTELPADYRSLLGVDAIDIPAIRDLPKASSKVTSSARRNFLDEASRNAVRGSARFTKSLFSGIGSVATAAVKRIERKFEDLDEELKEPVTRTPVVTMSSTEKKKPMFEPYVSFFPSMYESGYRPTIWNHFDKVFMDDYEDIFDKYDRLAYSPSRFPYKKRRPVGAASRIRRAINDPFFDDF